MPQCIPGHTYDQIDQYTITLRVSDRLASDSTSLTIDGPICVVDVASFDFGSVEIGADSTLTFTIRNDGRQDLYVSLSLAGDCDPFTIKPAGSFMLGPGQDRPIAVTFSPEMAGDYFCMVRTGHIGCEVACFGTGDFMDCQTRYYTGECTGEGLNLVTGVEYYLGPLEIEGESGDLQDVILDINIVQQYVGDLVIWLGYGACGGRVTWVKVLNRPCDGVCSGDVKGTYRFSDGGPTPLGQCGNCPPEIPKGCYVPLESLREAFAQDPRGGCWWLMILDNDDGNDTFLDTWCVWTRTQ